MPLTIVVADDTPDYRLMVRSILASVSETMAIVGEAADGEEALALVRRERPDIVITDLVMPRLNGVELTRRIRQELPRTKIILMSSYTEDAYRLMASDSGADAFLSKQVITSELLPVIGDVIRRRLSGGSGPLPPGIGGSSAGGTIHITQLWCEPLCYSRRRVLRGCHRVPETKSDEATGSRGPR